MKTVFIFDKLIYPKDTSRPILDFARRNYFFEPSIYNDEGFHILVSSISATKNDKIILGSSVEKLLEKYSGTLAGLIRMWYYGTDSTQIKTEDFSDWGPLMKRIVALIETVEPHPEFLQDDEGGYDALEKRIRMTTTHSITRDVLPYAIVDDVIIDEYSLTRYIVLGYAKN